MKRTLLIAGLALAVLTGCGGDDRKAIPPTGPMTPPGPDAEQEGTPAKGKKANTADEK
jgi:hypothetical protein